MKSKKAGLPKNPSGAPVGEIGTGQKPEGARLRQLGWAIIVAALGHQGQKDKGGESYILHPLSVMFRIRHEGGTEAEQIVAVLHDLVEDTDVSLVDIREDFGEDIAQSVDALTRREGETYAKYIQRAKEDPVARGVKIADLLDNLELGRRSSSPTLRKRYEAALSVLL